MRNIDSGTSLYEVRRDLGYYLALLNVFLHETPSSLWESEEKVTTEFLFIIITSV
jgi:hypothetical protein